MTWTDTLPAIPLARGVAVRSLRGVHVGSFPAGVVLRPRQTDRERVAVAWLAGDSSLRPHDTLRVDLADPGGFGYALRFLMTHTRAVTAAESHVRSLTRRWLESRTTDTDRLALAQAIADVVETKGIAELNN